MTRLAIFLLLWLAATDGSAAVPAAQALWDRGSYRQAFAAAIEPANAGDPQAQFLLGEAYRLGRSVDPDAFQARDWYLRAARQGYVASAAALGELLVHMRQSRDAVQWLTLAASHDHARATALLAAIYYTGDGAQPDLILATSLMKKAAALGSPEAKARLAMMDDTAPPVDVSSPQVQVASAPPVQVVSSPRIQVASSPPVRQVEAQAPQMAVIDRPAARSSPANVVQAVAEALPKHAVRLARISGRVQVGAFRSADNARRAVVLLTARLHNPSSSYATIHSNGYYKVLLLIDGSRAADQARLQLAAIGWQHFSRSQPLRRA